MTLADAIAVEDWPRALVLAIEAWRASRSPVHANLVDRIALRIPNALAPNRRVQRWWMDRARTYDPATAGMLLQDAAVLASRDGVVHHLLERLGVLEGWPDDPRTARALATWFTEANIGWMHAHRPETVELYERIARALVRLRDTRVLDALADVGAQAKTIGLGDRMRELAAIVIAALETTMREQRPLERATEISRWVPAPASEPATLDERALWRDAGDSADARLVLADYLLERGDRRGEIITLALAEGPGMLHESNQLLHLYWERWMGELALVLDRGSCTFTGGLLDIATAGTARTPEWAYAKVARHRELATIRTLRPGQGASPKGYVTLLDALPEVPPRLRLAPEMFGPLARARSFWPVRVFELTTNMPRAVELVAAAMPDVEQIDLPIICPLDDVTLGVLPELPRMFPRLARVHVDAARPLPIELRQALATLPAMFEIDHGTYRA